MSMARKSKFSKQGRGRRALTPNIEEWRDACKLLPYDYQIADYFSVSKETFYSFLDRERYKEENGEKSEYLDAYKSERNKTKKKVLNTLLDKIDTENSALIFCSKVYGGLMEEKEKRTLDLKKKELILKSKAFLTNLAKNFNLNPEQLSDFADRYFASQDLELND